MTLPRLVYFRALGVGAFLESTLPLREKSCIIDLPLETPPSFIPEHVSNRIRTSVGSLTAPFSEESTLGALRLVQTHSLMRTGPAAL